MEDSVNFSESGLDYFSRKLNLCGVCKLPYDVGNRIPRILVNCGHTYCTSCLLKYYRKSRIRCPFCSKLVKKLDNVEILPLNINIFAEVVQKNAKLQDMLVPDNELHYHNSCGDHSENKRHLYCSFHNTNFCRTCMNTKHKDNKCCVVELNDINKLFQLFEQNQMKNAQIIKTRNMKHSSKKDKMREEFFVANN